MTPADLAAWRAQMTYTQRQAAAALGVTLATYQRLERGAEWTDGAAVTIDRRTALACAALAAGLSEWSLQCGDHRRPGKRSTIALPRS